MKFIFKLNYDAKVYQIEDYLVSQGVRNIRIFDNCIIADNCPNLAGISGIDEVIQNHNMR